MAELADALRVARERFGIERLHPEQERAIGAVLAGRDALVVLPTGYGKSLIYQAPALLLARPLIAVSPLIALMRAYFARCDRRDRTIVITEIGQRDRHRSEATLFVGDGSVGGAFLSS